VGILIGREGMIGKKIIEKGIDIFASFLN